MDTREKRHIRREQMSETLILNLLLAFSGGFQDAYTYVARDHVFANAQTGNLVLMSVNLLEGQIHVALRYLLPAAAFALGVMAAEWIGYRFKNARTLHWRQGVLLIEICIMLAVGLIPDKINPVANSLVSLACAMQVQSFRKVQGNPYASTMLIGNLRSGTVALARWARGGGRDARKTAADYFWVILLFTLGAGLGGVITPALGLRSVWICAGILMICAAMMERDREK